MRTEKEINAKINYLGKVFARIIGREKEITGGRKFYELDSDEKYKYGVLMGWRNKITMQIDALRYAMNEKELQNVRGGVFREDIDILNDIMGGKDLFQEDPIGFAIQMHHAYLSEYVVTISNGKTTSDFVYMPSKNSAHIFKVDEAPEVVKELIRLGGKKEYIYG